MCKRVLVCVCVYVHLFVAMNPDGRACLHVQSQLLLMCVCVSLYVCVYVCVCMRSGYPMYSLCELTGNDSSIYVLLWTCST